ncbi:ribonuclease H-like domain-containing protein [Tanacetum coccineum]
MTQQSQPLNHSTTEPTSPLPTSPVSHAQQPPISPLGISSPIEPQPARTHSMVTRSQSGIIKPIERLSLHTSSLSPIPKSPFIALKDPNWCNAIYDVYNALVKNATWILVPRPSNVNLVRSMWLFKHKFHVDDTLSRYKSRLVANGSNQQYGVDFDETFSPVVNPATIRTVLMYMHQPPGFVDSRYPNHVCLLQRPLYGLKQAPYDIILTASSLVLLQHIIDSFNKEFDMTDLGALNYFLGIFVVCHPTGLFLSQKKYALQLLERAHMVNCNPSRTLVDTDSKLGSDGVLVQDPTLYRSLAGGSSILPLLSQICPMQLSRFIFGYTDADWAGCPSTCRSTFGYYVFLGDNLLSWYTKRQHTISHSSAEAEYRGVANVVAEIAWLRKLLRELHSPLLTATLVYCDSVSAGHVRVLHVPSRFQYADIFTKGLPLALFEDFRSSLSVRPLPA